MRYERLHFFDHPADIDAWMHVGNTLGGDIVNFVAHLDTMPTIEAITDNVETLFGYSSADITNDKTNIDQLIYQKDIKKVYLYVYHSIFQKKDNFQFSFRLLGKDNTIRHVVCNYTVARDDETKEIKLIGTLLDVTNERNFENQIRYLTYHDTLTGLVNRQKIRHIIQNELENNIFTKTTSALLFLGLNRFKNINETLGHEIGDKLLQHVSHRLGSVIKQEDTLARIGGDEFVILISNLNHKTLKSHTEIIAQRVYTILERPFAIEGNILHITASIGVSFLGIDGDNSDQVLKNADTAMHLAKKDQDNYLRYYQSTMQESAAIHLEVENDLRAALKNREFTLFYQPQVNIHTDEVIGAEALIRWQHPHKGMISPLKFIPIAEETGLIIPISEWVLAEACKTLKQLQTTSKTPKSFKKISVNISNKHFKLPSFTTDVIKIIKESGIDANGLELEVTEGALIANIDETIEKMLILKELGIKIAIDDFGTGYSSLSYLKRLPVDILKIDKSFVMHMDTDHDDKVMTHTIVQMSRNLGLGIIAEGVEKVAHLHALREMGCDTYQGYLFSKPINVALFKELLFLSAKDPKHLFRDTAEA